MNPRFIIFILIAGVTVFGVTLLTGCLPGYSSFAQEPCCTPPPNPPGSPRYVANGSIVVTISSAFTPEERADIINAFAAWSGSNSSGVTFTQFLTGETPVQAGDNQYVGYDSQLNVPGHMSMRSSTTTGGDYSTWGIMSIGPNIRHGFFSVRGGSKSI